MKLNTKINRRRLIIVCLFLLGSGLFSCGRHPQTRADSEEEAFFIALGTLNYFNYGNCVHSYRQGSELGKLKCSRASRTLCRNDILYDGTGNLIVTSETQSRYVQEWAALGDDLPNCKITAASALLLTGFMATGTDHNNSVPTNNYLSLVDNCADLGNADISKLADSLQYAYLISARGVIAWQAKLLGQSECLAEVTRSAWERSTAEEFAGGNLLLETTCFYGQNALVNKCTATEKTFASAFDFTGAL